MTDNMSVADNGYDLSPQQGRIVGIKAYLAGQDEAVQNVHCCWHINAAVNVQTLQQALTAVAARWEIVRTNYIRPAGFKAPLQVINEQVSLSVETSPLDSINTGADQLSTRLAQQARRPFALDSDTLLRVYLYRQGNSDCYLQLVAPALSFDVSGLGCLFAEIGSLYQGNPAKAEEQVIQFVDVANWLNELHQADEFTDEQGYWLDQPQSSTVGRLKLGDSDRASGRQGQLLRHCDADMAQQIRMLATQHELSEQTILFTLWQCLLASYSDWTQLTVALAVEERQDELTDFVGLLCCYLPITVTYAEAPALATLLRENQQRISDHQDRREHFNWRSVANEQQPNLARYGFSYYHHPQTSFGGLNAQMIATKGISDLFDLQLSCALAPTGLELTFDYDNGIFDAAAVNLVAARFEQLLSDALTLSLHTPTAALNGVSAHERQLMAAVPASSDIQSNVPVDQRFGAFAAQTPDHIALQTEQQQFTYAQINARAEQLATALQAQGIGRETPVAVCTGRDEYLIISLLAILKVGGIYVPLDPQLQAQRIAYIIKDSGCRWVLTVAGQSAAVEGLATPIMVDQSLNRHGAGQAPVAVDPAQLAYLIYTSGSTGNPKGVGISHRALGHYVNAVGQRLQLSANAEMLALAGVATDLGHTALFGALLSGRTLRLLSQDKAMDANSLAQHLAAAPVACLKIVPSHLRALLSVADPARLLPEECLVLGGEALPASLIAQVRALKPGLRIINHYGPTETTVGILSHEVTGDAAGVCPVGRPFDGTRGFVVNALGQLAGVGVIGELYLGGETLAEGYWQRADLTAEHFVPDVFSGLSGKRLYRSGDLAYYRADGELVYAGRCDHQVKVRGFRVELGEIEAALCRHPQIAEAVVVLQSPTVNPASGDGNDELRSELVAHLVLSDGQSPDMAAIQAFLASSLPDYMIPVAVQAIRQLPLTRSGKTDRHALPRVERQGVSRSDYQAAQSDTEIMLATLWQELLGIERVGVNDNFFAIGGDSIVSIQLAARLNQLGYELMPKQIFDHSTISQLSQVIVDSSAPEIDQRAVVGDLPLTPSQQRYFQFSDGVDRSHYNQAMMFDLATQVSFEQLSEVIKALGKHHDMFAAVYEEEGQAVRQYIPSALSAMAPLALVPQRLVLSADHHHSIAQQRQTSIEQAQASLDISRGLNARVLMFEYADSGDKQLLICLHHLVVDGFSWRILIEDLNLGLQQCLQRSQQPGQSDEKIKFAAKTSSFKDWADHLRVRAQSDAVARQRDFWLAQQTSMAMPLDLSSDPEDNKVGDVTGLTMTLEAEQTRSLLQQIHGAYNTRINDILLAALSMAYTLWSDNAELVVELEGHGREHDQTQGKSQLNITRTLGWFTSRYPLKLRYTPGKHGQSNDLGGHIVATKELLRSVPDNGVGYGLLRYLSDDLSLRDELDKAATDSISLNYLGQINDRRATEALAVPCAGEVPGAIGARHRRTHKIAINGLVQGDQLRFELRFSKKSYRVETIERLSALLRSSLLAIIEHCRLDGSGAYSPSDFPLSQLSQQQLSQLSCDYQLTPGSVEDMYPVTPLQHGMLFESQLNPGAGVNMLQMDSTLSGELSPVAWQASWQNQIDRHGIFRTAFIDWRGETPLQRVQATLEVPWHYEDWSGRDDRQKQDDYSALLERERTWNFDFEAAPLMRLVLVKWAEKCHKFVWTRHHALLDGWSSANVLQEVMTAYEFIRAAKPLPLPPVVPYGDYIAWLAQRRQDQSDKDYWRGYLQGFSAQTPITRRLNWQIGKNQDKAGLLELTMALPLSAQIRDFAKQHHYTPGLVFQVAWGILLSRYSTHADVVFGSVVSGRPPSLPGVEGIVGPLINTVPTRMRVKLQKSIHELMAAAQQSIAEREDYCYTPLNEIQQLSGVAAGKPLFASLFVIQNFVTKSQREQIEKDQQQSTIELATAPASYRMGYPLTCFITMSEAFGIRLYYDTDSIDKDVADAFGQGLSDILSLMIEDDRAAINDYRLNCRSLVALRNEKMPTGDDEGENAEEKTAAKSQICIAATFTPESVEQPLNFWINELSFDAEVAIAPYGQLFQQLIDQSSLLWQNRDGINVLLIKLDDWGGTVDSKAEQQHNMQHNMQHNIDELVAAITAFRQGGQAPLLVVVAPCAPEVYAATDTGEWIVAQENALDQQFSLLPDVHVLSYHTINRWYGGGEYYDHNSDKLAHIPYLNDYTQAIGAAVFRRCHAIARPPYKVLVADCDNTLWGGVCGEVGADGIVLDQGYLALQQKIVALGEQGWLLCLCSKNEPQDVSAVFEQRPDMLLSLDHIVARRINWQSKSANIRALADELNLGLDSFIFIDDDDVQCADVQLNCPAVTVLQVPKNSADIATYIDHVWAFDLVGNRQVGNSQVSAARTRLYQDNRQRNDSQKQAASLQSFIESLELDIQADEIRAEDIPRVSELLLRTNQFNFTSLRHSRSQLQQWFEDGGMQGLTVRVSDRFGDYGLVGVALYRLDQDLLDIDSLLLSCRALGRGVEHHMLRELGAIARRAQCSALKLNFVPSGKNTPARDFLQHITEQVVGDAGSWLIDATQAQAICYRPGDSTAPDGEAPDSTAPDGEAPDSTAPDGDNTRDIGNNKQFDHIARTLHNIDNISHSSAKFSQDNQGQKVQRADVYVAPKSEVECYLAQLWTTVLAVEDIGLQDSFFLLGGHSLVATRVLSQICNHFSVELSLASLFESPTLAEFAIVVVAAIGLADAEGEGKDKGEEVSYQFTPGDTVHSLPNRQTLYKGPYQHHWNMAGICQIRAVDPAHLALALGQMLETHQGLRHRFYLQESGLVGESVMSVDEMEGLERIDLSALGSDEAKKHRLEFLANEFQFGLNMASRLHKFVLFEFGDQQPARFLWIFHHSLMDAHSFSLFFGELMTRYLSLLTDSVAERPPLYHADPVVQWGDHLYRYANDPATVAKELDYWTGLPWQNIALLADFEQGIGDNKSANVALYGDDFAVTKYLDRSNSRRLLDPGWLSRGIGIADLVLYAFGKAIATICDSDSDSDNDSDSGSIFFDRVVSGRDSVGHGVDVSQTIGWFSENQPAMVSIDAELSTGQQIRHCQQQMAQLPTMGMGFNAIKWLNDDAAVRNRLQQLPAAEFLLNYLPPQLMAGESARPGGLPWELIGQASENVGFMDDQQHQSIVYPSYVLIRLEDERFCITWSGRDNIYHSETLDKVTDLWVFEMRQAIELCCDNLPDE